MNRWNTRHFADRHEVERLVKQLDQANQKRTEQLMQAIQEEMEQIRELRKEIGEVESHLQKQGELKWEEAMKALQEGRKQTEKFMRTVQASNNDEKQLISTMKKQLIDQMKNVEECTDQNWRTYSEKAKERQYKADARFDEIEKLIKMLLLNSLSEELEEIT
jgi:small-conductance mechanosensitive channel